MYEKNFIPLIICWRPISFRICWPMPIFHPDCSMNMRKVQRAKFHSHMPIRRYGWSAILITIAGGRLLLPMNRRPPSLTVFSASSAERKIRVIFSCAGTVAPAWRLSRKSALCRIPESGFYHLEFFSPTQRFNRLRAAGMMSEAVMPMGPCCCSSNASAAAPCR